LPVHQRIRVADRTEAHRVAPWIISAASMRRAMRYQRQSKAQPCQAVAEVAWHLKCRSRSPTANQQHAPFVHRCVDRPHSGSRVRRKGPPDTSGRIGRRGIYGGVVKVIVRKRTSAFQRPKVLPNRSAHVENTLPHRDAVKPPSCGGMH
jgi:hypothetical protein